LWGHPSTYGIMRHVAVSYLSCTGVANEMEE